MCSLFCQNLWSLALFASGVTMILDLKGNCHDDASRKRSSMHVLGARTAFSQHADCSSQNTGQGDGPAGGDQGAYSQTVPLPFGYRWRRKRQLIGSLSVCPCVCQMVPERFMAPKNITVEKTIQVSLFARLKLPGHTAFTQTISTLVSSGVRNLFRRASVPTIEGTSVAIKTDDCTD